MQLLKTKSYLILFLSLFFQSCGLWDSFTTYFNLYYNASDFFEQGEQAIREQKRDLFATGELIVPNSANQQFGKVIEKCSQILQFHPDGSYVDDALLMLGKSFYYQKNYQKGFRKFQELIATQPESDLILETRLWIGKTEMRLRNYESALQTLGTVRGQALADGREDILKDSFVEEIVYRISREDYQVAIGLSKQLITSSDDETIKAEVLYEMGKLYIKVNESQNAISAYNEVFEYSPSYEIEVGTKLELGKVLRTTGENEKALEIFEIMRSENKFSDVYDQVDLETGITLIELNRLDEALDKLEYVDTAYVATKTSGVAKYKLGELYQYNFQNFDSAASYYQKASISQAPQEYILESGEKARIFKKYQNLTLQVNNYMDELFYVENPEEFTKDSIKYVQDSVTYVQDSLKVLAELNLYTEHLESLASFDTLSNRTDTTATDTTTTDSTMNDSTAVKDSTDDKLRVDQESLVLRNRNSRESSNVSEINIDSLFAERWEKDRVFPKKPVKSELSTDSLKSLLVKNKLELGNLFLTELELPDSAYYDYLNILSDYPNTSLHATVLYALGSYYLTVNQETKADSLFNVIYERYKDQRIANAAANKLNKPLIDFDYDPAKDLYVEAESELLNKDYESSIYKFYMLYKDFPQSLLAPKALYASGWILENELSLYDSAAIVYDTMSVRYPQSEYSLKVRPKLTSYKLYKKAVEDSLKRIDQEKLLADSLAVVPDSLQKEQVSPGTDKPLLPTEEDKVRKTNVDNTETVQSDTLHRGILNDPRRNPRRR